MLSRQLCLHAKCRETSLGAPQALDQISIPSEPGQHAQTPHPTAHSLQVWCYVVQYQHPSPAYASIVILTPSNTGMNGRARTSTKLQDRAGMLQHPSTA